MIQFLVCMTFRHKMSDFSLLPFPPQCNQASQIALEWNKGADVRVIPMDGKNLLLLLVRIHRMDGHSSNERLVFYRQASFPPPCMPKEKFKERIFVLLLVPVVRMRRGKKVINKNRIKVRSSSLCSNDRASERKNEFVSNETLLT